MNSGVLFAFGLTVFAGLATGIGSFFALWAKRTNTKFLSTALGFSAGVMIYISLVEILSESTAVLSVTLGDGRGPWVSVAAFFGGVFLTALIDRLVPVFINPHESHRIEEMAAIPPKKHRKLLQTGLFTAVVIALHNFPEGLATFFAALSDPKVGTAIACAVAIHNIPEGIAVSVPVYYATGSRRKAFIYSFLSGLAEPLSVVLVYFVFQTCINEVVMGILLSLVAGIMVFISFDELLPAAHKYGAHHYAVYGLILGMGVMAFSMLLL